MGANLLGIVNDILDFEKIRSGMLRIEHIEFDLAGLLHSVVTMVRSSAEEKHLALQLVMQKDLPEVLLGDPMRLTQILINLLSNAIKFTSSGSVTLRIQVIPNPTPDATIRIRFEVEDTGIGIAASEHERIFERFIQASSETSRKFGTGLGLALVKMLVGMQKGSISLVSKPGEGSIFSIEIPYYSMRKEMRSENEIVEVERYPDLNGHHILLVEDNAMNRRIAELYLLQLGLTITQAVDGIEALDLLREKPSAFDLVSMDIQMPRLDGYATAKAIRQELKLTALPIIAMTAHVLSGEREKVLGFVDESLPEQAG